MKSAYLVGVSCVMNAFLVLGWSGDGGIHRLSLILGGFLAGVIVSEICNEGEIK